MIGEKWIEKHWSMVRDFRDHVFELDADGLFLDSIEWIRENLDPDDIFSNEELEKWAEENGYKKDGEA